MTMLFPVAATAVMLGGAGAIAAELPTFEALGFPITLHQIAVLGAAHVQEQAPVAIETLHGMPASPVQVLVLTPRSTEVAVASKPSNGGPSTH